MRYLRNKFWYRVTDGDTIFYRFDRMAAYELASELNDLHELCGCDTWTVKVPRAPVMINVLGRHW